MKKVFLPPVAALLLGFTLLLQGCFKDSYKHTFHYTYYKPIYKTTAEVRSNIKSNAAQKVESPGKIYVRGQYIFLNEVDKGIHVIDNSDPAQPKNIGFITIPGNMDIAVKGNTLYADLYTDLVAIDITNPTNVALKKVTENVFPHRYYNGVFSPDSTKVIAGWERRDTTVTEEGNLNGWWMKSTDVFMSYSANGGSGVSVAASPYGVGGSTSRFATMNDRLYTVGNSSLMVFNISNANDPAVVTTRNLSWNIETIYPFMDKLFIGSTSGMFIFNVSNPDNPVQSGQFGHVESCDPVIADNQYAFVTLRSGSFCQGFTNELEVLQLNSLTNPALIKAYPMTNPRGLSKDGNTLFICDGRDGVKVYDASNVSGLHLIKQLGGFEANDVITLGGTAIVVAKDGLYQFNYTDLTNIKLLSKIALN